VAIFLVLQKIGSGLDGFATDPTNERLDRRMDESAMSADAGSSHEPFATIRTSKSTIGHFDVFPQLMRHQLVFHFEGLATFADERSRIAIMSILDVLRNIRFSSQ